MKTPLRSAPASHSLSTGNPDATVTDPGRRDFVRRLTASLSLPFACAESAASEAVPNSPARLAEAAAANQSSATAHTQSDVGSLWPFIQSQAVSGEFPLSWLRTEFKSLPRWKRKARGKLLELLHYSPAKCDLRAEVVERVDAGEYVREKVYFNTSPDIRVPAFVLVPKNAKLPAPGLVALHDHGGFYFWGKEKIVEIEGEHSVLTNFKKSYYGGKSIASELARQGYVVIVIDMFYWGERRMLLDDDPADWRERPRDIKPERIAEFNRRAGQSEQLVGRTIYSAGFTWPGVMFWDDVRTVDYLLTRPEVDKKRIGCVGLSVGGLRSCHLAALDERVKAAVVVGWMASFPRQLRRHIRNTIGHTKVVPGLYRHLDYPDVASLAMPRALLVINGSKDGLFDLDGVRASFDKLSACYKKAGVPEKCRTRLYDTPHEFNAEMQAEAWEWLRRWV
ncbi:MAG: dienelactone hydrolase family protein [Verrucomicrobia bacterium]|nr:dienelactone hydrolase family protein [Verrucomicrobiota bacterium]